MPLMRADLTRPTASIDDAGKSPPAKAPSTAGESAAASKPAVTADVPAVVIGYAALAVGAAVGIALWKWRDPAGFQPGSGISVFAPLYILAQGIERFLEPFSNLLGMAAPEDQKAQRQHRKRKADARDEVNKALARGRLEDAANWQRVVDRIRRNTAVVAWGLASATGMVLCGLLGLFMLRLVGFTSVPKEVDIVITGLAVGSGTKPLHDLISNLQQSKEQKEDPPEKQSS